VRVWRSDNTIIDDYHLNGGNVGETIELTLDAMAHGGSALGRHDGRVIFVPYTIPGERVQARITDDKERYAHAEPIAILDPSPDRVEPLCPHFGPGKCGGCHLQHVAYDRQLEIKRRVVIDQLERIGKFADITVHPTIPSPSPWAYRSHATFHARADGRLGYYSDDASTIVPIEECHIIRPTLMDLFSLLDLGAETIERVKLQVGTDPADCMIILSTTDDLAPEIEVDFPVSVNLLLSDNEPVNLIGSPQVTYQVFDRAFQVTAGGFFQTNVPIAEMLVEQVLLRLDLQGDETVLDLYSGVGLFTAFIAERAGLVVSVESYPPAVTDADANLSDLDNVEIVEGPVEEVIADLAGPFNAIVVDPPRTGLSNEVIDEIVRLDAPRVVYVSCDPATLARDARKLAGHGYRLVDVQPADMFPQTYHVEAVALLES
jgi:23S rRNA (uracil1939-C5)-methyltransferase